MQSSPRNIYEAPIFVVCAPHILEETGSEIRPRGCDILRVLRQQLVHPPGRGYPWLASLVTNYLSKSRPVLPGMSFGVQTL